MMGTAGLAVCAAAFPWLYREFEVPYALRAGGVTGAVLWGLFVAAWVWGMWRFEELMRWAREHRGGLSRAARWASVYYGPILVGLFYFMWLLGRLDLGKWPQATPAHDPKGIPLAAFGYILICVWFWSLPLVAMYALARWVRAWWRHDGRALACGTDFVATVVLGAVAIGWIAADPHELVKWFLD